MAPTNSDRVEHAQSSILRSARQEIETSGILGLRVAEVAAGANCSITQIYRYFGDRNGLLARVLGDMYAEILVATRDAYSAVLLQKQSITVDDIVAALPAVFEPGSSNLQHLRLQILAASVTNEELRARLEEITRDESDRWDEGLDEVENRLAPGESFDRRVFTIFLANFLPYYRILLGDKGFSSDEFRGFLRDKMSS